MNVKATTLHADHLLHTRKVPLAARPIATLKTLLAVPFLALALAASGHPLPSSNPKSPQISPEKEHKEYAQKIDNYKKNPTALKDLLVMVWCDLGLPKKEAETLVGNSFQSKSLLKTNLSHKSVLLFAETDLLNAPLLPSLRNYFKIGAYTESLGSLITLINENHSANLPPLKNESATARQEAWANIEDFSKTTPACLSLLAVIKESLDATTTTMLGSADGWAIPNDNVYVISSRTPPRTAFQYLLSHEATHCAQSTDTHPLTKDLSDIREQTISNSLAHRVKKSPYLALAITKDPEKGEKLKKSLEEDFDYLASPHEIAAWAGMIKKVYYSQTKKLLTPNSSEEDLSHFDQWLANPQLEKDEYKYHVINSFKKLKELMYSTPKAKTILHSHLKETANVKQKKPESFSVSLC